MFGILLLDEERDELVLRKAVNFGPGKERSRIPVSEGLCGAAVRSREPVLVGDVRKDPRYVSLVPETRSELVVPLVHKDRVIGVFDLESPRARPLHRGAREGAHPAREPGGGGDRERAALRRDPARTRSASGGSCGSPGTSSTRSSRRARPRGPAGRPRPTSAPPASSGGDLYDFYDMGGGLLGVATGDVAGQGRPGGALRGLRLGHRSAPRAFERRAPADLMQRVNRTLRRRGIEGLFCTLAYALFDFQDRSLRVANSGLPHPLPLPGGGRGGRRRSTSPGCRSGPSTG